MGLFRRKVPHDYVPIHPDNIATNNWIILLEGGDHSWVQRSKTAGGESYLGKKDQEKIQHLSPKKQFLVLEGDDPRIHAVYFCPQLYKYDGDNALAPLTGEEIGQLVAQSVTKES